MLRPYPRRAQLAKYVEMLSIRLRVHLIPFFRERRWFEAIGLPDGRRTTASTA